MLVNDILIEYVNNLLCPLCFKGIISVMEYRDSNGDVAQLKFHCPNAHSFYIEHSQYIYFQQEWREKQ
jgi:hypothetical protein